MVAFTRHLYRLMHTAGIHDFQLKARRGAARRPPAADARAQDMTAPEAKRLERCLSGVLNFAKYREDMVEQWADCRDASQLHQQRLHAAQAALGDKARARPRPARHPFEAPSAACAAPPHPLPAQSAELARLLSERATQAPVRPQRHHWAAQPARWL